MKKSIFISCILTALTLSIGCTHLAFKNSYKNTCLEPVSESKQIKINKVAILPFADYSFQQTEVRPLVWGLNRKLLEELTDEFVKRGIMVAVQEDTEGLLISEGIIQSFDPQELSDTLAGIRQVLKKEGEKEELSYIAPERELARTEHSSEMISEIHKVIGMAEPKKIDGMTQDEVLLTRIMNVLSVSPHEPLQNGVTASLSREKIIDLGRKLNVDAIVRGRIIDAGTLDKTTAAFSNQGVIPFLIGPLKNLLLGKGERPLSLGLAEKEKYELDLLDTYSVKAYGTGKKASVLQVRVYLQDARTGDIIWTGRAEADYNPDVFKKYYKGIFDKVCHQVAFSLGQDLFSVPKAAQHETVSGNKGIIYSNVQ